MGRRLLAAGLVLAPAIALAQQAPAPAPPPPDAVGPKALQDFSLSGTVTRQADQPATQPAAPPVRKQGTDSVLAASKPSAVTRSAASAAAPKHVETASAPPVSLPKAQAAAPAEPQPAPTTPAPASTLPAPASPAPSAAAFADVPKFPSSGGQAGMLASGLAFPLLAWLLAALAVIIGAGLLFWRSRSRLAFAGHAEFDLFAAPEPAPDPAPAPAPRAERPPAPTPVPPPATAAKTAAPAASGVISTGLRPWIDIGFQPIRCVVQEDRVTVEFELELFNSGSAPARAVLVEARLFNAGADQDAQIAQFFANPIGTGERVAVIPPLKRLTVRSQAIALRDQVLAYELAGHPVFVPLVGFNALYSWSGGQGQTSVSHLIGRDTRSEKLGPFRLDLGPHIFRNLAARLLPSGIRR